MISLKNKSFRLVSSFGSAARWHAVNESVVVLTQYEDGSCEVEVISAGITTIIASDGKANQESIELKVLLHGLRYGHLNVAELGQLAVAKIEITPCSAPRP